MISPKWGMGAFNWDLPFQGIGVPGKMADGEGEDKISLGGKQRAGHPQVTGP
jgi:hypothetical protein